MKPRRLLRALSYLLIALVVGLGAIILVAVGQGYSYNFKTGRFVLKGLIIFGSNPSGAQIELSGRQINDRTPHRLTLEAGDYQVKVGKEGYLDWSKLLTVRTSEVTLAQYIFLFPREIRSRGLGFPQHVVQLVPNRDRRQLAMLTTGSEPGVWLWDLGDRPPRKLYTPRGAAPGRPPEELLEVSWAPDSSMLMLKTRLGDSLNHLLIPPGGGEINNLTDVFKFELNGLQFNPANTRELYWISQEGLRRLDTSNRTVSAVLASNALAYSFGGGRVYLVQQTPKGKSLVSLDRGDRLNELVPSLPESNGYQLVYAEYQDEPYLAVLTSQARTLTLYTKFLTNNPEAKVISKAADQILFSPSRRFLAYYTGRGLGTYDLEKSQVRDFDLGGKAISHPSWFDDFHLLFNLDNQISVAEFDGANLTAIAVGRAESLPVVSNDRRLILYPRALPDGRLDLTAAEIKP